ncbi:MAG: aconitate hydratase AcnA [Fimbriimonadaceae bacterium]
MNSFGARSQLSFAGEDFTYYSLPKLQEHGCNLARLPFSIRILLECLVRKEDGVNITKDDILAVANWDPNAEPSKEISFTPSRVLLQDFTGVPCVVDLAAMRDAMDALGGDPNKINPIQPVELVIDHSVQVDSYGLEASLMINRDLEFERNRERYEFLKWGQGAFKNFKVVPPNTGIVHQVNIEYLARVVFVDDESRTAYPDTLVGTDSHTTMVNGLGVLGWGVGGIEAEAAMLGQPVSMLLPQVVGFKFTGRLREVATSTDLVLTVTEMLRKHGVVGKFVEFFGPGLEHLTVADRATIGNMAPEYGATCGIFPVDEQTLDYLHLTGRSEAHIQFIRAYMEAQGMLRTNQTQDPEFSSVLELDLSTVEPSVAGPKRPQDRSTLSQAFHSFSSAFGEALSGRELRSTQKAESKAAVAVMERQEEFDLKDGDVVIAAITSCTNTSNPALMIAAGLVAKKAVDRGVLPKIWVKTSLAPGSRVVTEYLEKSGLQDYLDKARFNTVGYGCTTCIGNSGPLPEAVSKQIHEKDLITVSVLSGNRNFEGRINPDIKANYLMSPPLVVAYALAGTININLETDPLTQDDQGNDVYLKDLWPTPAEVQEVMSQFVRPDLFSTNYASVYAGDEKWNAIPVTESSRYSWDVNSTYIKHPPYFVGMSSNPPEKVEPLNDMRVLAILGDSVTTDHISPAGAIKLNSPAGEYLTSHGVEPRMFNSYGSRRGNHEVMVRGTFANIRLRNQLAPGTEGGFTTYLPSGEVTSIFEAAERYRANGTKTVVLAGKEYGSGSSRDWAAKGPMLLGIHCVIAESFERIHRSNLVGMGVLPLQFAIGDSAHSLGLTGEESFDVVGISEAIESGFANGREVTVRATAKDGTTKEFVCLVRIDTPQEVLYYRHGGILQYVLRQLLHS